MKLISILLIGMIIFSCGKEQSADGDVVATLGELRAVDPNSFIEGVESEALKLNCIALKQKETKLRRTYAGTDTKFNFQVSAKACTDEKLSDEIAVTAQVQEQSGKLKFISTTSATSLLNTSLHFSSVVTASDENFSETCSLIQNEDAEVQRAAVIGNTAYFYSVLPSTHSKCNGPGGEDKQACILIETGFKQTNNDLYKISIIEIFKVDLDDTNATYGMVLDRQKASFDNCSDDEDYTLKRQTFVSIE